MSDNPFDRMLREIEEIKQLSTQTSSHIASAIASLDQCQAPLSDLVVDEHPAKQ